eukprot:1783300-Rhodomonas_salina.1
MHAPASPARNALAAPARAPPSEPQLEYPRQAPGSHTDPGHTVTDKKSGENRMNHPIPPQTTPKMTSRLRHHRPRTNEHPGPSQVLPRSLPGPGGTEPAHWQTESPANRM